MTRDDVSECFDPGFLTICHHTLIALSDSTERERGGCRPSTGSSRRARAVSVDRTRVEHGPGDTGGFGGERHHHDLVGPTREQIAEPGVTAATGDLGAVMYTASECGHLTAGPDGERGSNSNHCGAL